VHDLDRLIDVRVVPLFQYFVGSQIGVQDDLPANALDHSVFALIQANDTEALRTEQILNTLRGSVTHDIAFKPEIFLLAEIDITLDARISELITASRQQVEIRPPQRFATNRGTGAHVLAGLRFLAHRAKRQTHGAGRTNTGEPVLQKLSSLHGFIDLPRFFCRALRPRNFRLRPRWLDSE